MILCNRNFIFIWLYLLGATAAGYASERVNEISKSTSYRALVLVLASDNCDLYRMFKIIWESYIFSEPSIKVLFIYGKKEVTPIMPWDLVFPNISESYPVHLDKVFEAFAYVDSQYQYDFLIRTNLSTFWVLRRLLEHLDELPTKMCYEGDGPLSGRGNYSAYVSGTDTIVNRYMVTSMIEHKDLLDFEKLPEDMAMGQYFHGILGAPIIPSSMHFVEHLRTDEDFENQMSQAIAEADSKRQSHFRIKTKVSKKHRERRLHMDERIARALLGKYYNKTVPDYVPQVLKSD